MTRRPAPPSLHPLTLAVLCALAALPIAAGCEGTDLSDHEPVAVRFAWER